MAYYRDHYLGLQDSDLLLNLGLSLFYFFHDFLLLCLRMRPHLVNDIIEKSLGLYLIVLLLDKLAAFLACCPLDLLQLQKQFELFPSLCLAHLVHLVQFLPLPNHLSLQQDFGVNIF